MKITLNLMSDSKKAIRKQALNRRNAIVLADRKKFEESIRERLFALPEFRQADKVLFYASIKDEVNTEIMVVDALDMGKTVLLPKVNRQEKRLRTKRYPSEECTRSSSASLR